MAHMYLMVGVSGAGKTTFSKKFAEEHGLLRLGIDDLYAKINGDECKHVNTFDVWIEFFKAIHETEINDIDCVIDTNALTWHQRMQFIEWFPTFTHHIIYIETDHELCKKNNKSRKRQVPDDKMDRMIEELEVPHPTLDTRWDSIIHVKNVNNQFYEPKYYGPVRVHKFDNNNQHDVIVR